MVIAVSNIQPEGAGRVEHSLEFSEYLHQMGYVKGEGWFESKDTLGAIGPLTGFNARVRSKSPVRRRSYDDVDAMIRETPQTLYHVSIDDVYTHDPP